jgi:outer membrane protein TolC
MIMPNLTRFAAFIPAHSLWTFDRCSARSRGISLRYAVWLVVLCTALAAPAWAEEIAASRTLLWLSDFAAPPESHGASASARERVTLDEAIALALDANRLAKKAERLQLVREGVIQAYGAVLRAQRALEIREGALRMCRELDRLLVEQADRGAAVPSVVFQARAARARATSDVLSARQELDAWSRQLNHLMGRDPQARLLVTREPGPPPAAAIRLGVTATGK